MIDNMQVIDKAQQEEHKAWLDMFDNMCKILNIPSDKLNKMEYRTIFIAIEKWGYTEWMLRQALNEYGDDYEKKIANEAKGLFWKGD